MKTKAVFVTLSCCFLFIVANMLAFSSITSTRSALSFSYSPPKNHLPSDFMKLVSGEFKGLVSDYILLEIGSFLGSNETVSAEEWRNIAHSFEQALALDPYFQQTYLTVQGNLAWDAKLPEKAIQLLDISRIHRPQDWRPGHYMGFDYFYFLNDYANASDIFLKTAKIEGAPLLFALLGARFALKTERANAAISLLSSILEDQHLEEKSKKEIRQRIADLEAGKIRE